MSVNAMVRNAVKRLIGMINKMVRLEWPRPTFHQWLCNWTAAIKARFCRELLWKTHWTVFYRAAWTADAV